MTNKEIVRAIIERIWNECRVDLVDALIAPQYTVHRDPRDPWDGRTLDHAAFKQRVGSTFAAFPDQRFIVEDMLEDDGKVAVRWTYRGTHTGDLPGLPASGRAFEVCGMTIYAIADGRATGHWQALDRIDLMRQLGAFRAGAEG